MSAYGARFFTSARPRISFNDFTVNSVLLAKTGFRQLQMSPYLTAGWPNASEHPFFYVGIYAGLGFASAMLNTMSAGVQYAGGVRASRGLFVKLLRTMAQATIRWHDTTPQGEWYICH
jgi:hypothetical protein